jgi:hypothetical protein
MHKRLINLFCAPDFFANEEYLSRLTAKIHSPEYWKEKSMTD